MKLSLRTPSGWTREEVADGELLRPPHRAFEVLVMPMEAAKLEPPKHLYEMLVRDRPGIEPPAFMTGRLKTAAGWIAVTVDGNLGAESRFVAYFTFLDLSATVIATRTGTNAPFWRDEVIELLYLAAPDFTGDHITGLRDLLGAPPPTTRMDRAPLPTNPWRRTFAGGDVVFIPRLDPDSGWIRYSQGRTPLRRASELFAAFDGPPELAVTDDGEYCAVALKRQDNTQRALAVVFGAESYTQVESVTTVPDRFNLFMATTRALAAETMLGYGSGRMRPFYYEAPEGWQASPRSGSTLWISPTCARRYHVLRVFDACLAEQEATVRQRRFQSVAAEFLTTPPIGPAVYYTKDEHEVRVYAYQGSESGLRILDAAVIDQQYCYPVRIECDPTLMEESMHLLEQVVRTIVPLPSTIVTKTKVAEGMSHWTD